MVFGISRDMASATDVTCAASTIISKPVGDTIEEDLTCSLCHGLFNDPKDLDCPHVFCLNCLTEWVKVKSSDDGTDTSSRGISCPECRQNTAIPKDGLAALKTNARLRSLSEKYAVRKANVSVCYEHDEIKHFFCMTCGVSACHVCLKLRHESMKHTVKGLKDVSQQWKAQMKLTLINVQGGIAKEKEFFRHMAADKTVRINKASEESIRQIKERVQVMVRDIERTGHSIEARVKEIEQEYLQQIKLEISKAEKQEELVKSVLASMQSAIDNAPDHDYVTQHAELMEKLETTCISQRYAPAMPKVNVEDFHLHPGCTITTNTFGSLPVQICKATLVDQFGVGIFKKAQGIASTRTGLIAIADTDSNKVCVYQRNYDSGKYEFNFWLCSSDVSGSVDRPFDVAILSGGKMFVTSERKVNVFSSTGQFERSFKTTTSGPSRITSSEDDNILVADDRKRIITLHHPSGQLLRRYLTSNTAINIATNDKMIAITNQSHGNVCVIDAASGKEILNFRVGRDEATTGICFVDSCHSLLVSVGTLGQTGHDRIEQYCCLTGRLISRVIVGLYAPMCLTLLKDNQLAVADVGRIAIYSLEFSEKPPLLKGADHHDNKNMNSPNTDPGKAALNRVSDIKEIP